jgi:hypothetical protein
VQQAEAFANEVTERGEKGQDKKGLIVFWVDVLQLFPEYSEQQDRRNGESQEHGGNGRVIFENHLGPYIAYSPKGYS